MALGGRVSEELYCGTITTGAQDDLQKVTGLAYSQINLYGMNEKIGPLSFKKEEYQLKPYSEETAETMDEEVRQLIRGAYSRTMELLSEKKEQLEKVAKLLLEKEVIYTKDLIDILGERPWTKVNPI